MRRPSLPPYERRASYASSDGLEMEEEEDEEELGEETLAVECALLRQALQATSAEVETLLQRAEAAERALAASRPYVLTTAEAAEEAEMLSATEAADAAEAADVLEGQRHNAVTGLAHLAETAKGLAAILSASAEASATRETDGVEALSQRAAAAEAALEALRLEYSEAAEQADGFRRRAEAAEAACVRAEARAVRAAAEVVLSATPTRTPSPSLPTADVGVDAADAAPVTAELGETATLLPPRHGMPQSFSEDAGLKASLLPTRHENGMTAALPVFGSSTAATWDGALAPSPLRGQGREELPHASHHVVHMLSAWFWSATCNVLAVPLALCTDPGSVLLVCAAFAALACAATGAPRGMLQPMPFICWPLWALGAYMVASSFWALGEHASFLPAPCRHSVLVTDGAFEWCRHPQYTGMILVSLGVTAYWHHLEATTTCGEFWTLLLVCVLDKMAEKEEMAMEERYAEAYLAYKLSTPKFIPWCTLAPNTQEGLNRWSNNIRDAVRAELVAWWKSNSVGSVAKVKRAAPGAAAQPAAQHAAQRPLLLLEDGLDLAAGEAVKAPPRWGTAPPTPTPTLALLRRCACLRRPRRRGYGDGPAEGALYLPAWAYDAGAHELIQRSPQIVFDDYVLKNFCGPAIPFAFKALANYTALYALMPLLAYWRSSCPDGGGFAVCDDTMLYVIFVGFAANAVRMQNNCVGSVLLPQLGLTKEFKIGGFSFNMFDYRLWIGFMSLATVFNLLDAFTNAEVLGKVWATAECKDYGEISTIWSQVMRDSFIAHALWLTAFDWTTEITFAYSLILILPVFALFFSVPIDPDVAYAVGAGQFEYHTLYEREELTHHGHVLQLLAVSARMEGVVFQDRKYVCHVLDDLARKKTPEWEFRFLMAAHGKMARGALRFFLVATLQNAVQANVQLSLMAVTRAATGGIDVQTCFSVVMSIIGSIFDFPHILDVMAVALHKDAFKIIFKEDFSYIAGNEAYHKKVLHAQHRVRLVAVRFAFFMLLNLGFVLLSAAKIWGYIFCESHLMNAGGCAVHVNVSDTTNSTVASRSVAS